MEIDDEPPPVREPVKTYFDERLGAWVRVFEAAWAEGSESFGTVLPRGHRDLE